MIVSCQCVLSAGALLPGSDLLLALSGLARGLDIGFGFLARHLQVGLYGRRAQGRPQRADRLFEGHRICSGDLRLELSERDVQVVRDVFSEEELALVLESGGSRLQARSRG